MTLLLLTREIVDLLTNFFPRDYYEENPFRHQDLILYAEGEMIAIKHETECYWYRAKVIHVEPDHGEVKVWKSDIFYLLH